MLDCDADRRRRIASRFFISGGGDARHRAPLAGRYGRQLNQLEKIIVGSFNRINFNPGKFRLFLKALVPSLFFSLTYFLTYLIRHFFTFHSRVSFARFCFRVVIMSVIVTASLFTYLDADVLLGIKIGYFTNILCTILVFIIGVPLSRATIARSLAEQVHGHHYNWFINFFRKTMAFRLKAGIEAANIVEMDTVMDAMIGPLLIAIEVLGAIFGALIPLFD